MPTLALAFVLLTAAVHADAGATPISFELAREPGAERCPDHDTIAAQVAKHLSPTGPSPHLPVAEQVSIAIKRTSDGHLATVSALGIEGGVRHLWDHGDDCAGLAEALVLTLSMIADGRPVPPPRVLEQPRPPRPPRPWEVGAGAFGSTGILGKPSLGLSLDGAWHPWPRLAAGLSALWLPSRTHDEDQGATRFMMVAGMARLCGGILPFGGRVFPALCGVAGAGALRGAGDGYEDSRSVWVPWLVAGSSFDLSLRLHRRLSLVGRAGYLFSLRTERFSVQGVGQIHSTDHPGFTAQLGISLLIP